MLGSGGSSQDSSDGGTAAYFSRFCDGDECPICLDPMTMESAFPLQPCGHAFHRDCVGRWIGQEKSDCPSCRKFTVLEDDYPSLK